MLRMNWARGLFRVWVILTLAWAALLFMDERPDQQLRQYLVMRPAIERAEALANAPSDPVTLPNGELSTRAEVAADLEKLRERQEARLDRLAGYAQSVALPSVLLFALGVMAIWAIRGFGSAERPK